MPSPEGALGNVENSARDLSDETEQRLVPVLASPDPPQTRLAARNLTPGHLASLFGAGTPPAIDPDSSAAMGNGTYDLMEQHQLQQPIPILAPSRRTSRQRRAKDGSDRTPPA